jgi:cyanuric acid amidohydrolase
MTIELATIDMAAPDDIDGLARALDAVGPIRRLAVLAKLEAQPGREDESRRLARRAVDGLLAARGLAERAVVLLAVGCEGVATPFAQLIVDREAARDGNGAAGNNLAEPGPARLALGIARSAPVAPAERGTRALIDRVAETVRRALADAALVPTQVGLALVKCPVAPQDAPGASADQRSLPRGRAIAALGAGVALGEIAEQRLSDGMIARDVDVFARRAMTFAGPEIDGVEAVVLGNRPGAGGALQVISAQLADILDAAGIRRMLGGAGVRIDSWGELVDPDEVAALLLKAGVAPDGRVRGRRTTVFSSGLAPDWHMRAAQSGLVGSLLGHTRCFISGDPIQQAAPGGAVAAAIVRVAARNGDR